MQHRHDVARVQRAVPVAIGGAACFGRKGGVFQYNGAQQPLVLVVDHAVRVDVPCGEAETDDGCMYEGDLVRGTLKGDPAPVLLVARVGHGGHRGVSKGLASDGRKANAERQARKRGALCEGTVSDGLYAIGKDDLGKGGATVEGTCADLAHAVRHGELCRKENVS